MDGDDNVKSGLKGLRHRDLQMLGVKLNKYFVYIESAWYTSESNLSALLVRKSNVKVLIKSSYVISSINSREWKLYQVITASKPNYSYCTYVFLLFRHFYKCNIHHPFSQGGVISKISVCSYNYIFQHTCMPRSGDILFFFFFISVHVSGNMLCCCVF